MKMKKKILFLDHTPFVGGGAAVALVRHIEYLDKDKFEPFVACSSAVPELVDQFREAGAQVFVVPFKQLKIFSPVVVGRFFETFREIWGILKKKEIDIVVTNAERGMYVGTLAAVLRRKPLVWWVRDYEYNRFLFKLLSRFPKKIIFVSKSIRNYYSLGSSGKAEVVYVGSDFDKKLKRVRFNDVLRVKEELGLTGATLVVGYVGRLVKWKGPQVLVEAIRNVKAQMSNVKCVLVGTGEGQEGNIEPELPRMVKKYGLEDMVILTGQRRDVPTLMRIFDVFCHTSIEPEPFATVVVEAMMAGVPVIGHPIGGTPEIISDSQTGFLIPPNDPKKLAAVLSHLASDPKMRRRVGEEGRKLVLAKNTEVVVTKQVEKIYNEISNYSKKAKLIPNQYQSSNVK